MNGLEKETILYFVTPDRGIIMLLVIIMTSTLIMIIDNDKAAADDGSEYCLHYSDEEADYDNRHVIVRIMVMMAKVFITAM